MCGQPCSICSCSEGKCRRYSELIAFSPVAETQNTKSVSCVFLPSAGQAVTRQPVSTATCVSLCLCLCISHLCVWLFVSVVSARVCFVCLFSISAFLAPGTMGWAMAACLCSCLASSLQHYWVDSWPPNCRTRPHWAAALMLTVDLSFFIVKLCIQRQRLRCETMLSQWLWQTLFCQNQIGFAIRFTSGTNFQQTFRYGWGDLRPRGRRWGGRDGL